MPLKCGKRNHFLAKYKSKEVKAADGLGQLDGESKIKLDAVALRPRLKKALDDLEAQDVMALVTTPARWISSIVAVPKKNGKLHICLDPKDLNRAIQGKNYQLPTVEGNAIRLH